MTTPFDGHRAVWIWQFSAQGEGDIGAVASTLRQYASADVALVKAMDGTTWQASFDNAPHAIGSLATWQATVTQGAQASITVLPWVVAHGPRDAVAHARLGDTLIVDLEPYPGFWTQSAALVPAYLQGLRDGGVRNLYVSIDPRPSAMTALDAAAWAGTVDGLLPQVYWTDFTASAASCLPYVQACLALNPAVWPALPYNGGAADLTSFWQACAKLGCQGASLWRLGTATGAQLHAFGALPLPAAPVPVPTKPHLTDADRYQFVKYVAGGSGVADLTAWLAGYTD